MYIKKQAIERTGPSPGTPVSVSVIDTKIRTWMPAVALLLAAVVTPARAKLDVRRYEWAPQPTGWMQTAVTNTVRTWAPAFTEESRSVRTSARPPLDVRRYEWSSFGWIRVGSAIDVPRLVGPRDRGDRTRSRPALDVRAYDWAPDEAGWVTAALLTTAQTLPAINPPPQFRTRSAPILEVQRQSWQPLFGTPDDPAQWPYLWETGGRTRARPTLDVRMVDWAAQPAWIFTNLPAAPLTTAQAVPAFAPAPQFRTETPRFNPVRLYDRRPIFGIPDDPAVWPMWDTGGRTRDHSTLDLRSFEWAPDEAWIASVQPPPPATAAQFAGLWEHGDRTRQRLPLDVRAYTWTDLGWIRVGSAITVPRLAGIWAHGDRTTARLPLDVRTYDWAPQPAWITRVSLTTAQLADLWFTGDRTLDGPRLDVRAYTWAPSEAAWLYVVPPPVAPVGQTWVRWTSMRLTHSDTRRVVMSLTVRGVDA